MFNGSTLLPIRTFCVFVLVILVSFCSYLNQNCMKDPSHWHVVDPLPSYGQGIDVPGKRYMSLINGDNVHDVVVTGYILDLILSLHLVC